MAKTSPNQRTLVGVQKEPCDKEHIYARINKDALFEAIKNLNGGELSLWLYFASQSENIKNFAISPTTLNDSVGMAPKTYQRNFNGLVTKGYLLETSSNHYKFYEIPISQRQNDTMEVSQVQNDPMSVSSVQNDPMISQSQNDTMEKSQYQNEPMKFEF